MENLDQMNVSEEKKKYIVEQLNPLLESIVRECLKGTPDDPVPFMLQFLEDKRIKLEEQELTEQEKAQLEKENEELEAQMVKVKSKVCTTAKFAADDEEEGNKDEEDEDEDDDDEEPPPGFFTEQASAPRARASVSAEAYGEWNRKKKFVAPVVSKTDTQKDRLKEVLSKSFMFSNLDENDLAVVIGAMSEVSTPNGDIVIKQGDAGDFLFVVESGTLDCLIKTSDGDKVVKTCVVGDVVGELALLYNAPRAATVKATSAAILWQLDRDTFTNLVRDAAQKKRERYDKFLNDVPLLQNMDAYERGQLSDALKTEVFGDAEPIVKAGDVGNKFYIIETGDAVAEKNGEVVMQYKAGDYFGELALIRNQPRAATVTSKGMVKLLSLDSGSFNRLLNVNDLLERATQYT
mmetsp:Transcript_15989/g.36601  ORF Transcript_15989/g.36601 Transcript_15989/m.36601 type:complete len:406 (-) Transcript_15989:212-1429(-)